MKVQFMLPSYGETIWHYQDSEKKVYGKFNVQEIRYNVKPL
jgi:hypothetical protein